MTADTAVAFLVIVTQWSRRERATLGLEREAMISTDD
jgi:hypothetical protein